MLTVIFLADYAGQLSGALHEGRKMVDELHRR
jgi:hypothetical protein